MSTREERYADAVAGIALARETIRQVSGAIRQGMDQGDDPVIILHNMASSMSQEASFRTGGKGAAAFVTACFLLAESGFFDEGEPVCVCPGYSEGTYLETCRVHGGSWAETLAIMADPQAVADLEESRRDIESGNLVDASMRDAMERRHSLPVGACTDPDCFVAGCDGDHEPRRCPTTDVKRGNMDTVDGRWTCCGGLYPTHIHADPFLVEPDRYLDGGA